MTHRNTFIGRQAGLTKKASSLLVLCAASALSACGGGDTDDRVAGAKENGVDQSVSPNPIGNGDVTSLQKEGGRLNAVELEQIAKTGVLPEPFEGPLLSGASGSTKAALNKTAKSNTETQSLGETKSAASRTAVYRFFNNQTSAHFFTTSTTERDSVRATLAYMTYEGPAFYASSTAIPGLSPVHRFYNTATGVHFYTISETERAHVAATLPQFNYEGIAYYASTLPGTGYIPLYRFFHVERGFHFYTNSAAEKDNIIATLPQYRFESVGYYVLGSDWQTPAVPHTGITSNQCFQSGSNAFVACSSANALALSPDQDGHRASINPMSYSQLISGYSGTYPFIFPLYYPKTACIRDNVTGLVWEGKDATGNRAGSITYTNQGNDREGDTSVYVSTVNSMRLCGFDDWRLPTFEELQSVVNYGVVGAAPKLSSSSFPNTSAAGYWTSSVSLAVSSGNWVVNFMNGSSGGAEAYNALNVRLVRGKAWVGSRYLIGTQSYPGDAANNAVIDRKTGLTWRRCEAGRAWTGLACSGNSNTLTLEEALRNAASNSGWRLPNIKELASLPDRSRTLPALEVTVLFPGARSDRYWSSSPAVNVVNDAWSVNFYDGALDNFFSGYLEVRLVHSNP